LGTVPVLLAIALGGALGSLARWGVAEACVQAGLASGPADWPWATLLVNVIGALAIGAVLSSGMLVGRPRWLGAFLVTGILGGFTTFSALALETVVLLDGGRAGLALGYVALTVIVGLLAVRLGSRLATHRRGA
jgi:CrcB protein